MRRRPMSISLAPDASMHHIPPMTKQPTFESLYCSDTNDYLSAEDLGLTCEEYDAACVSSANLSQAEGHIRVFGSKCGNKGRRVYAA